MSAQNKEFYQEEQQRIAEEHLQAAAEIGRMSKISLEKLTELLTLFYVFLEFVQEESHSILLSSHITSDLEKAADYITFIHNGKLIMTVSKNDLVYNYAVMRCKESQFLALDPSDIIAYRKRDFPTVPN